MEVRSTQIFGYTLPDTPTEGYVGYLQAFTAPGVDTVNFTVRPDGSATGTLAIIEIPKDEARRMAEAILANTDTVPENDKADIKDIGKG